MRPAFQANRFNVALHHADAQITAGEVLLGNIGAARDVTGINVLLRNAADDVIDLRNADALAELIFVGVAQCFVRQQAGAVDDDLVDSEAGAVVRANVLLRGFFSFQLGVGALGFL